MEEMENIGNGEDFNSAVTALGDAFWKFVFFVFLVLWH
jgi:hypothetical protein